MLAKALAAGQIEVVARLVENQHVRLHQQCTEQGDAAAFTTTQLRRRSLWLEMAKAFVLQRTLQPLDHIPAAIKGLDVIGMRLTTHDPLQGIKPLRAARQVDDPGTGRRNDTLGQISDAPLTHNTPITWLQLTGQQTAENAFADAITSYQADVTFIKNLAEPFEQRGAVGKAERNALERDKWEIGHPCLQAMP